MHAGIPFLPVGFFRNGRGKPQPPGFLLRIAGRRIVPGDEKQAEFVERSEQISDFRTDNLFANIYYEFNGRLSRDATPHLGAGAGVTRQRMFYSAASIRTNDRERMRQLGRNPHAAELASLADETLSDRMLGFQFVAGVDYAMGERF